MKKWSALKAFHVLVICFIAFLIVYSFLNFEFDSINQIVFVFVLVILFLLSVFTIGFGDEFRKKVVLVGLSTVFSLHLVQFLSGVYSNIEYHAALSLPATGDQREKSQVIDDLRREGHDAYPLVHPRFFLSEEGKLQEPIKVDGRKFFPIFALKHTKQVVCNELGFWLTIDTDRYGFPNADMDWDVGSVDVAFIGDSFTAGSCVKPDQKFSSLIAKRFGTSLNFGIVHNGPLLELAILKEFAVRRNPKIVVWSYFEGNDLEELSVERNHSILSRYTEEDFSQEFDGLLNEIHDAMREKYLQREEGLREKGFCHKKSILQPSFCQINVGYIVKFGLFRDFLKERIGVNLALKSDNRDEFDVELNLFQNVLKEAERTVRLWGGRLVFVYLPGSKSVRTGKKHPYHDRILDRVRELNILTVDTTPALRKNLETDAMFVTHFTPEGNVVVSEEITRFICENQISGNLPKTRYSNCH